MYFHTDNTNVVEWLSSVLALAKANEQRIRIDVGLDGTLYIKRGEGVWSAPIYSTPDPYRDKS